MKGRYLDIYFTPQYGKIYENNNEGKLIFYDFESQYGKVYYMFLVRKVNFVEYDNFYDIITPYGYGGPLFLDYDDKHLSKLIFEFDEEFKGYCMDNNIVSEFVRFHPLIKNYRFMDELMDIFYIRDTIYLDLSSPEIIWNNMESRSRTKIRKNIKNNILIENNNSRNSLDEFLELYKQTMDRNNATDYYYFKREFFQDTMKFLKNNVQIFNAKYNGKTIASNIVLHYGDYVHGHLAASDYNYRHFNPHNILLYKIALWGFENGYKFFHLGGGYSGNNDSLFSFKKGFNKNGRLKFYIGKKIHNKKIYKELVELRKKEKKDIDENFFPIYRG